MYQFLFAIILSISGLCYYIWNENAVLKNNNLKLENAVAEQKETIKSFPSFSIIPIQISRFKSINPPVKRHPFSEILKMTLLDSLEKLTTTSREITDPPTFQHLLIFWGGYFNSLSFFCY